MDQGSGDVGSVQIDTGSVCGPLVGTGCRGARVHHHHSHVAAAHIVQQRLGKPTQPELGGGIRRPTRVGALTAHRSNDEDVPLETSLKLIKNLKSDEVQLTLVKNSNHQFSKDGDLKLIFNSINKMLSVDK